MILHIVDSIYVGLYIHTGYHTLEDMICTVDIQ